MSDPSIRSIIELYVFCCLSKTSSPSNSPDALEVLMSLNKAWTSAFTLLSFIGTRVFRSCSVIEYEGFVPSCIVYETTPSSSITCVALKSCVFSPVCKSPIAIKALLSFLVIPLAICSLALTIVTILVNVFLVDCAPFKNLLYFCSHFKSFFSFPFLSRSLSTLSFSSLFKCVM